MYGRRRFTPESRRVVVCRESTSANRVLAQFWRWVVWVEVDFISYRHGVFHVCSLLLGEHGFCCI